MRDVLLVAFLFIAIYYSFKKPVAGLCAWIWIALIAPTKWAFGFSTSFRLNFTIVIVTILSYLVWKNKPQFKFTKIHFWVFFFGFWMFISSIYSLRIDNDYTWFKFIEFLKVITLFLFVTLIVESKKDIDAFIWAIVFAISAFAGMEAVKFILSGGGHRIVGKSGILADRNDLAVAINMCLPLVVYLWSTTKHKSLKMGLMVLIGLNVIAIIGTFSRGGFIGLSILAIAMWLRSNKKIVYVILAIIALPVLYQAAPAEWKERQSTIETASTQDGSFIGRLWAWKIATLVAIDNPITGGGFKATTDPVIWWTYAPDTPTFGPIETPPIIIGIPPKAAHNIYFQVLASAGFVGLFIFLCMLLSSYLTVRKCAKRAKEKNIVWQENLAKAISLSFIGYGITGMNVSLAYFELLYAYLAIIVVLNNFNTQKNKLYDLRREQ